MDCWRALEHAKTLAWLQLPRFPGGLWGKFDPDEYEHYNSPHNADMHQIVPGKLFALKAPRNLHGRDYHDDKSGRRYFSPSYMVEIFRDVGVSTVVSADAPAYDPREFTARGVGHCELCYGDGAAPSLEAVAGFFRAVDGAAGGVAVHSVGGHGRNGTLAALYLMRRHGFGARAAIAWVRICRPGSVLAEQHAFLCRLEAAAAAVSGAPPEPEPPKARLRAPAHPCVGAPRAVAVPMLPALGGGCDAPAARIRVVAVPAHAGGGAAGRAGGPCCAAEAPRATRRGASARVDVKQGP